MYGGVGGVPGNRAPIPIAMVIRHQARAGRGNLPKKTKQAKIAIVSGDWLSNQEEVSGVFRGPQVPNRHGAPLGGNVVKEATVV
ncbi:hypothetical protein Pla100_40000 [Neorhodopirellula pilleata]|uniref:Uncharacterized protein n=2 Tax=Neorhodopirellula pilleata TaxID=2714738 RepID=A0A5C6A4L9_9BACT|nr:hypothetical protein Pla100_40000 [Neorhodopirellula pilleata]